LLDADAFDGVARRGILAIRRGDQVIEPTTALVPAGQLSTMLALATEAGDITALKDIHALASALRRGAEARGMGLEAENQAAEVIIRAERAMGNLLLSIPRAPSGPKSAERSPESWTDDGSTTLFREAVKEARLDPKTVHLFQQVAAMPEDTFEALIAELRALKQRISRVNFYAPERKPKDVTEYERAVAAEAPTNSAFTQFRAGAYALLGWEVDEDGVGRGGPEVMLTLPADELVEIATLIKALVGAYQQARAERAAA
jgi:hypothetical protein